MCGSFDGMQLELLCVWLSVVSWVGFCFGEAVQNSFFCGSSDLHNLSLFAPDDIELITYF